MTFYLPRTYDERLSYYKHIAGSISDKLSLNLCMRHAPKTVIPKLNSSAGKPPQFIMDVDANQLYFNAIKHLKAKDAKDSMDGEAHTICFLEKKGNSVDPNCSPTATICAVKVAPLTVNEETNQNNISYPAWREIEILKLCTVIVLKNQVPNLPVYYGHFICNKTDPTTFKNTNIQNFYRNQDTVDKIAEDVSDIRERLEKIVRLKMFGHLRDDLETPLDEIEQILDKYFDSGAQYSKSSVLIVNELCDYDFKALLPKYISKKMFKTIDDLTFQILAGAYMLNKYGVIHMDLHHGNILVTVMPSETDTFIHYTYNNTNFYVPPNNALMKIWDFGRSCFWKTDKQTVIKKVIQTGKRYFEDFYTKNLSSIKSNLETNYEKCIPLLFSIDTFRYLIMLRKSISMSETSVEQKKYLTRIEKMERLATHDLTKKLARGIFTPQGNSGCLIEKFFTNLKKKPPKNSQIYNNTPFTLS